MVERIQAAFQELGRDVSMQVERRLAALPRGDTSGWYYVESVEADLPDGRRQATVKRLSAAVGAGNPAIGPLPCLRGYTPVVGHKVLVRWVAGDRADGVIDG